MSTAIRRAYVGIALSFAMFMSACNNTELVVSGPPGKEGIPFRVPETYIAKAKYTKLKSGKPCNIMTFTKFVYLPTGDLYHVSLDHGAGLFLKSEFTAELNPNGTLKKIVFSADPELSETIQSAAGLVTAIAGPAPESAAPTPEGGQEQSELKILQGATVESLLEKADLGTLSDEGRNAVEAILGSVLAEIKRQVEQQPLPPCDTGEHVLGLKPYGDFLQNESATSE